MIDYYYIEALYVSADLRFGVQDMSLGISGPGLDLEGYSRASVLLTTCIQPSTEVKSPPVLVKTLPPQSPTTPNPKAVHPKPSTLGPKPKTLKPSYKT